MTALLWASYKGHLPVVRELVNVYRVDLFQKDKVRLTHALVTVHYNLSYRTTYVHRQIFCVRVFSIPPNNGIHLVHSKISSLIRPKRNSWCLWQQGSLWHTWNYVCNAILHSSPILVCSMVHLHNPTPCTAQHHYCCPLVPSVCLWDLSMAAYLFLIIDCYYMCPVSVFGLLM